MRLIEKVIIEAIISDVIMAGYFISVNNGTETTVKCSRSIGEIMAALCTTDEDFLYFHHDPEIKHFGWVRLIYGNDGWDIVADYSTNLDVTGFLKRADEISEKEREGKWS